MSELCAMVHVALHRLIKIRATLLDLFFFFATFASFYMHNNMHKVYTFVFICIYIYNYISMLLEFVILNFVECTVCC